MTEEDKEIEENYKRYVLGRPHIVILGAGATMAAIPNGDKNGKRYIPDIYEYIVTGKPLNLEKVDESVTKAIGIWKDATSEEVTFTTNFYDRISSFSDADAPEDFAKYFDLISKGEVPYLCDILNAGNILFRYKEILGLHIPEHSRSLSKVIS